MFGGGMHTALEKDIMQLRSYLAQSVAKGESGIDNVRPRPDVTALMYFFWDKGKAYDRWPEFKGALLETWRHCGMLKTVIVSNVFHHCLELTTRQFPNVEIQVEPRLVPGDINTMSIDCNSELCSRFNTNYVLTIQDDGFPLRPGLDEFVEMDYDFIGAPYCRPSFLPNLLTRAFRYCPSNGGFSLRSRRFCSLVAEYWRREYVNRPFIVNEMSEDLFCTMTLPRHHLLFWMRRRQSPSGVAARFSHELFSMRHSDAVPFGFHTATAFGELNRKFGLNAGV